MKAAILVANSCTLAPPLMIVSIWVWKFVETFALRAITSGTA